ncbi:hypothetical protein SDC9_34449 [bioreactor metagenome]|uniref:HTH lysR-type domain-containing protein n=1 Tax=bioreactor metagenome TaxID=1076179 RepID=A0A644VAN8_9ZZZZ
MGAGSLGRRCAAGGIVEEGRTGGGQRRDVARIDQRPGLGRDDLLEGADAGRHHRHAAGHRLERGEAEALPALRRDVEVKHAIPVGHPVDGDLGREEDAVFQPRLLHLRLQPVQKRPLPLGRAAHHQGGDAGPGRQQRQHRVDEGIGALLRADPAIAADQHPLGQAEPGAQRGAAARRGEALGVDTVQDHMRRALEIGCGARRGGDDVVHLPDQPFRIAGVAALAGRGEEKFQLHPEEALQRQPEEHLGVTPRMPDPAPARQQRQPPDRHMRQRSGQAGAGGDDADHPRLHRHQPRDGGGDPRQAAFQVRCDDLDRVGKGRLHAVFLVQCHGLVCREEVEGKRERERHEEEQEQHAIGEGHVAPRRGRPEQRRGAELRHRDAADRHQVQHRHPAPDQMRREEGAAMRHQHRVGAAEEAHRGQRHRAADQRHPGHRGQHGERHAQAQVAHQHHPLVAAKNPVGRAVDEIAEHHGQAHRQRDMADRQRIGAMHLARPGPGPEPADAGRGGVVGEGKRQDQQEARIAQHVEKRAAARPMPLGPRRVAREKRQPRRDDERRAHQPPHHRAPAPDLDRRRHRRRPKDVAQTAAAQKRRGQDREQRRAEGMGDDVIARHQHRRAAKAQQRHRQMDLHRPLRRGEERRAPGPAEAQQQRRRHPRPEAVERAAHRDLHRRESREPEAECQRQLLGADPELRPQNRRQHRQEHPVELAQNIGCQQENNRHAHGYSPLRVKLTEAAGRRKRAACRRWPNATGWAQEEPMDLTRATLRLYYGKLVFGPGKADLLQAIAEEGSISAAGRRMGMSYKRAWSLVEEMNDAFAEPLVLSARGGAHGGGAQLTTTGQAVLADYRALLARLLAGGADEIAAIGARLRDGAAEEQERDIPGGK